MRLALLGTGILGNAIAERILTQGHSLTVYNRTLSKTKNLAEKGAIVVETASEGISQAEGVLVVLSDASAVEEVILSGGENFLEGKTIFQMSTISSMESINLQKKVYQLGGEYLECPVLGSRKEALAGELLVMVGATQEKFDKWQSTLRILSKEPKRIGKVGKAAALKLALNHLIAVHAVGFSLSLGMVQKNEIDVEIFMEILRKSALYAPMYDKKLDNWIKQSYSNPNFPAKHLLKDVELVLREAKEKDMTTEVIAAIQSIYKKAIEKGFAEKDYSAVFEVIK